MFTKAVLIFKMSKNKKYFSLYKRNLCHKFDKISVKKSACSTGDLGSIPGSGRSPGEGNGNPLQYFCLENAIDKRLVGYSPWGSQVGHELMTKPPPTLPVFNLLKEKLQFKYRGGEKLLITFLACCTCTL